MSGYPVSPAGTQVRLRPVWWWYLVAGALVVVGVAGAILFAVLGIIRLSDKVDDFQRIPSSNAQQFTIEDTGEYSIYHEFPRAADGGPQPFVELTLSGPAGQPVKLSRPGSSVTYDISGHEGMRVFTFEADEPGRYLLYAQGPAGSVIAVGEGVGNDILWTIVGALLIGLVGFLGGLVTTIVTAVRRNRARKRLQPPSWRPPGYPPPGYPPPGYPPQSYPAPPPG